MNDATQSSPLGRPAHVTGLIAAGVVGEVTVAIRGGTETFYAHPALPGDRFQLGDTVLITDFVPPRTVRVVTYA